MKKISLGLLILLLFLPNPVLCASADTITDSFNKEYPSEQYIIGIGEVQKTNNIIKDRRTADIMARLRIAEAIRINIRSEMIDLMCEGNRAKLFGEKTQCRNEVFETIETTVDVFLEGTRIVSHGERDGTVYAVAVLKRNDAARELENKANESAGEARESIKKAGEGDKNSGARAQEEYLKAVTYSREKDAVQGTKNHSVKAFEELEKELLRLER